VKPTETVSPDRGDEEVPAVDDTEFAAPSHEEARTDVRGFFLGAVRMMLEMLLEEEIRGLVGAGRWLQVADTRTRATSATFVGC